MPAVIPLFFPTVETGLVGVVQTSLSYTLDNDHRIVLVTNPGVTLSMPPNPQLGEEHTIVAQDGDVALDGNGSLVQSPTIPSGTRRTITFASTGWF